MPYWIAEAGSWEGLPDGLQRAIPSVLAPAYRRLVLEAPGELERSTGITLVHLMWLEVCDRLSMAAVVADRDSIVATVANVEAMISRHLNLVTAKCNAAELLMKLRMMRGMLRQRPELPRAALGVEWVRTTRRPS